MTRKTTAPASAWPESFRKVPKSSDGFRSLATTSRLLFESSTAAPSRDGAATVARNPMTTSETGVLILERLPRVKARTALSGSEIYRRIAANPPTFPAPVKLGERASAWVSSEVDDFIEARIAARDAKGAA